MQTPFKYVVALFFAASSLQAQPSSYPKSMAPKTKIAVNNVPLAKIHGKVISLGDVVKELDLRLYLNSPEAYNEVTQRYGFYKEGWRRQLDELIQLEMLKKEAEEKKMKISDSDVRQELMNRYGTTILERLHEANLTYDDARESVKNDLLAQQMNWFGFLNKSFYRVGPQMLKTAYDEFVANNPPNDMWKYQFLTVRTADQEKAEAIRFKITALDPSTFPNLFTFKEALTTLIGSDEAVRVSISDDFSIEDRAISTLHKTTLISLPIESISQPLFQKTNTESIIRVFHLKDRIQTEVEPFSQLSDRLKQTLISKTADKDRIAYFQQLKEKSGYTDEQIYLTLPKDFEPFALKESF